MIDTKQLKEKMNTDDIITVVESLGGEIREDKSPNYIIFTSICHHTDANSHKPKLYFYERTNSFYCYSCATAFDIFALVEARWNVLDIEFTFSDVVKYVANILGYSQEKLSTRKKPSWRTDILKFTAPNSMDKSYLIYPKTDLNRFVDKLPLTWINEGISLSTMQKYSIGYYPLQDTTTIPVFDINGNLVGIHGRRWRPEDIEDGKYKPVYTLNQEYKFPTSKVLYGLNINKENIRYTQEVKIFEAPKSVMMCEDILDINNSVGLFGCNMSVYQRKMLLSLGVDKFVICLDKQSDADKHDIWQKSINRIIKLLKPYGEIYIVEDKNDLLNYKDSPVDKGKKIWEQLYAERIRI